VCARKSQLKANGTKIENNRDNRKQKKMTAAALFVTDTNVMTKKMNNGFNAISVCDGLTNFVWMSAIQTFSSVIFAVKFLWFILELSND